MDADAVEHATAQKQNSATFNEMLAKSLKSAKVEPVMVPTRDQTRKDLILAQRMSMRASMSNPSTLPNASAKAPHALSSQPVNHRMSRIGTMKRGMLVKNIEQVSNEQQRGQSGMGTAATLRQRLASLGLVSVEMEGDGNCQFRAVSDQLFGSQKHHAVVRTLAVQHMRAMSDFFSIYFESPLEFDGYLREMARSRTWGDELTLRAIVEAFGCQAHVVTSEAANWYLVYRPEAQPDRAALQALCAKKKLRPPREAKEVFITYISPVHYNAIAAGLAVASTDPTAAEGEANGHALPTRA